MNRLVLVVSVLGVAACLSPPAHHCDQDTDCGDGGRCRLTGAAGNDDRRCVFDEPSCESGVHWSDDAGELAGSCAAPLTPTTWSPCLVHTEVDPDDACAIEVCERMPRCCSHEWSDTCAQLADRTCSTSCGAIGAFVGDHELWVGAWDGEEYVPFWTPPTIPDTEVMAAAWADYDRDGLPDLATCDDGNNPATAAVRIWHNDGDDFTLVHEGFTGFLCFDLDWVDLEDDGDLDVVTSAAYQMAVVESQDGGWDGPGGDFFEGYLVATDWADLDGDGWMDFAVAHAYDPFVVVRNLVDSFPILHSGPVPSAKQSQRSISWGEIDGQGGLDLLVSGGDKLQVIANSSTDGFEFQELLLDRRGGEARSSMPVDVDGDGDLDILALDLAGPLVVYGNDGGTIGTTPSWSSLDQPFAVEASDGKLGFADIDGDNDPDVVACANRDYCRVWLNDGAGRFERSWDPDELRSIRNLALTADWR